MADHAHEEQHRILTQHRRNAQLEFAEESAYYNDRQTALAAVQIARRLNTRSLAGNPG